MNVHPNAIQFMESAVKEALEVLDAQGHPHRRACNLAGAWGLLKGQLASTPAGAPAANTCECDGCLQAKMTAPAAGAAMPREMDRDEALWVLADVVAICRTRYKDPLLADRLQNAKVALAAASLPSAAGAVTPDEPPTDSCLICGELRTLAIWHITYRNGVCHRCRAAALGWQSGAATPCIHCGTSVTEAPTFSCCPKCYEEKQYAPAATSGDLPQEEIGDMQPQEFAEQPGWVVNHGNQRWRNVLKVDPDGTLHFYDEAECILVTVSPAGDVLTRDGLDLREALRLFHQSVAAALAQGGKADE